MNENDNYHAVSKLIPTGFQLPKVIEVAPHQFPPQGYIDHATAASLLSVGTSTLNLWIRKKRFPYQGTLMMGPNNVRCRVYEQQKLLEARKKMEVNLTEQSKLPEGYVDFEGVAVFFGVHKTTLNQWQRRKWLSRGKCIRKPDGFRIHIFAISELEQVKAKMEAEAQMPAAPEGFIDLHEAAKIVGISVGSFRRWEMDGKFKEGTIVPIPGTSARTKIYPIADVEQLRQDVETANKNFPPQGWVEMEEAARRANVSINTWKRWLQDGRVQSGRYFSRPTMARCKLFRIEEIEQVVLELGRDHDFFMVPDGQGGFRAPDGYVSRIEAAAIFNVASRTFNEWQSDGRITCGRWARLPMGHSGICHVYPVDELKKLAEEFNKIGKPYIDPSNPNIARVPIMSWSETRFEALIDAEDLHLVEGKRWNWMPRSDNYDAVVALSAPAGEQIPLRRILLGLKGAQYRISHRNGDALDCRRENLVVKSINEQLYGTRKRRFTNGGIPCTSQYKGVSWNERSGKWKAQIQKEGVCHRLGYFEDEIAAAQAYDEAATELFGEFARPNFPKGVDEYLERQAA